MSRLRHIHHLRHGLLLLAVLLVLTQMSMEAHWHLHDHASADCSVCHLSHGSSHAHSAPSLILPQPVPQLWRTSVLPVAVIVQPRTSVRSRAPPLNA